MQACILFYTTGLELDGGNLTYYCQSHCRSSTSSYIKSSDIAPRDCVTRPVEVAAACLPSHFSDTICNRRTNDGRQNKLIFFNWSNNPNWIRQVPVISYSDTINAAQCGTLRHESFRTRANETSNVGHDMDAAAA